MTTLFLVQLALPLAMIGWVALAPPRTLFGFCIQVIASAAALSAVTLLGIWLLPPWWAPHAFAAALAAANSGNTGEPHLHVHAQRPGPAGAPLGGDPLPILFGGRFPVRGDRIESP